MALTSPALAFGGPECGPAVAGVVTCSGVHTVGMNYVAGQDDLTINIEPGATVSSTAESDFGVFATTVQGDLSINQNGLLSTTGDYAHGIRGDAWGGAVSVTNTGTLTTTGSDAYGVITTAGDGDRIVTNTGTIATTGDRSTGVVAVSQNGTVTVVNGLNGIIMTGGTASLGVAATSMIGDVVIENHGSITTSGFGSNAIAGVAYDGDITLTSTGTVTTTGTESAGVVLQNFGGDITAVVGSVSADGVNSLGIGIHNFSTGSVDLTTSGTISATGIDGDGITVASNHGSVKVTNNALVLANAQGIAAYAGGARLDLVNTGAVSTTAANAHAIQANAPVGVLTILNSGSATTLGDFAIGLKAESLSGTIDINNQGVVSTAGTMANGVDAKTDSGDITLTNAATGDITTTGMSSIGVKAESQSGAITINNQGAVTTSGYDARGIYATTGNADADALPASRGDITLTNRGLVQTSGDHSMGIHLNTVAGHITADVSSVSTTGQDSDAVNLWTQTGDIALTTSGLVSTEGAESDALFASTFSGAISIINGADLTTSGRDSKGIYAQAPDGAVSIVNTGKVTTTGDESNAIHAQGEYDVTVQAAGVTTSGEDSAGVYAYSRIGVAKVVANGPITTTGENSSAIRASTDTGAVDILTLAKISTTGAYSTGVLAYSTSGDVNITTAAEVTTSGAYAEGIEVDSDTGKVTVVAKGAVTTSGENADAIQVSSDNDVTITTAAASTAGYSSDAIYASSGQGRLTIKALGLISTTADSSEGIDANSDAGDIDITVGSVSTTGDSSTAIEVFGEGDIRVVSTGAITTQGEEAYGIDVNGGAATFVDANSISTMGAYADGVTGGADSGLTTIKVKTITAMGYGSNGIDLAGEAGDFDVTAGSITAHDQAIRLTSGEGSLTVSTTGLITSAAAEAIYASTMEGDVVLNIGAGSVLTSGVTGPAFFGAKLGGGISTVFAEGERVTINNSGRINQGEWSTITAEGEVTLNNSGLITGNVNFGAGDDVINNTGRFVLSGLSDFGGGANRFVNTGLVTMQGNATLARLGRFVNAGTVNLADGRVGDVLTISGDYVGQNGRLVLDMDAGAAGGPAYDQLVVGGSASGTTTISLNYKTAAQLKPGVVLKLVDAAGGSAAGAFTMAAEATNIGFARYGVRHDVTADDFFIAVTEGDAVFRSLKLNEGAQTLWRQSADAWSAHTAALRDPAQAASTGRVWGQVYGASDKRDETLARNGNGVAQTVDLSYTQDHVGGQLGFDLGEISDTGVTFGLTGGYIDSTLEFRDKADSADYKGLNLGAYAGAQRGRYFVNALAKYDLIDIQARSATAGYDEDLDGRAYGLQAEAGARFNGQIETRAFFFEPVVSLAYSRTDLDALASQGAVIDFEALNGLRAKAGARLGGAASIARGQVGYYLGAHLVQELAGEDGVRFTSGATNSAFDNTAVDAFGQYQLGVTFTSNGGTTAFVEAKADSGEDYRNYIGRVGVRVSF